MEPVEHPEEPWSFRSLHWQAACHRPRKIRSDGGCSRGDQSARRRTLGQLHETRQNHWHRDARRAASHDAGRCVEARRAARAADLPAGDGPAEPLVAWDDLGAGDGQLVAFSEGGEAAQPFRPNDKPVDAYIAAIIDRLDLAAPSA